MRYFTGRQEKDFKMEKEIEKTTHLLRTSEVAKTLGVSAQTVRTLARSGAIRAVTLGTRKKGRQWFFFTKQSVDDYVNGRMGTVG